MKVATSCLIVILVLTGCSSITALTVDEIGILSKGMKREEVEAVLAEQERVKKINLEIDGVNYELIRYSLLVADNSYTSGPMSVFYTGGGAISMGGGASNVHTATYLYLLFESDRLLYWGEIDDFSKSGDPKIEKIAPSIINAIKKRR